MLQLLEFTAQWCGPCKRIHPDVMDLVEQYPKVDFKSIDADKSPDLFELVERSQLANVCPVVTQRAEGMLSDSRCKCSCLAKSDGGSL